ncbi:MAG TPA: hypothetical protein VFM18_14965 [Methanosarcina sp.]|nr:hypothetical protein [Methanosarcina sp.]
MTAQEFEKFLVDLRIVLSIKFNEEDTNKIVTWMSYFKTSDEKYLIGEKGVSAFQEVFESLRESDGYDLYNTLMARAFLYAPMILDENK